MIFAFPNCTLILEKQLKLYDITTIKDSLSKNSYKLLADSWEKKGWKGIRDFIDSNINFFEGLHWARYYLGLNIKAYSPMVRDLKARKKKYICPEFVISPERCSSLILIPKMNFSKISGSENINLRERMGDPKFDLKVIDSIKKRLPTWGDVVYYCPVLDIQQVGNNIKTKYIPGKVNYRKNQEIFGWIPQTYISLYVSLKKGLL